MSASNSEVVYALQAIFNEFHESVLDYLEASFRGRPLVDLTADEVRAELQLARRWHAEHCASVRDNRPRDSQFEKFFRLPNLLDGALARSDCSTIARLYFLIAGAIRSEQRVWQADAVVRQGARANHMLMIPLTALAATKVQIANLLRHHRLA